MLDPVAAARSREAGGDPGRESVGSGGGSSTGADFGAGRHGTGPAGTLHLAVPDDGGLAVLPRRSPPPTPGRRSAGRSPPNSRRRGELEIEHGDRSGRRLLLLVEGLLVALVCFAATGARLRCDGDGAESSCTRTTPSR